MSTPSHSEARARVCVLCFQRLGFDRNHQLPKKTAQLDTPTSLLTLLLKLIPNYSAEDPRAPSILCYTCSLQLRFLKHPTWTPKLPQLSKVQTYFSGLPPLTRSTKTCPKNCIICCAAEPPTMANRRKTKLKKGRPPKPAKRGRPPKDNSNATLSHSDMRSIQVQNGLSQSQLFNIASSLRRGLRNRKVIEPGLKEHVYRQSGSMKDIFEIVCTVILEQRTHLHLPPHPSLILFCILVVFAVGKTLVIGKEQGKQILE